MTPQCRPLAGMKSIRNRSIAGSCFFGKMAGSGRGSRLKCLHHRCRCWVNQAKSRFPSLFALPQVPLCRVNQAKIISLIGLEVPALRTLAGAPPRGSLSAPFFSADHQPRDKGSVYGVKRGGRPESMAYILT
jgi:hypothetical protein